MHTHKTHNGTWTVKSTATGDSRTFRVTTPKWADGKRVIGLLSGPRNTEDYRSFGFVTERGIVTFLKHRGTIMDRYASMLDNIECLAEVGKVEVMESVCCRRCSRPLTTVESIESGIGPICAEKGLL